MKFTIKNIKPLVYYEDKELLTHKHKKRLCKISMNGYAFMDEYDHCIMIAYGENRRDLISEYLSNDKDPLGIKYKYVDLNKLKK